MTKEELEQKVGQAYQVIGVLSDPDVRLAPPPPEGECVRAMDYFSEDTFDENFLPWPKLTPEQEALDELVELGQEMMGEEYGG